MKNETHTPIEKRIMNAEANIRWLNFLKRFNDTDKVEADQMINKNTKYIRKEKLNNLNKKTI